MHLLCLSGLVLGFLVTAQPAAEEDETGKLSVPGKFSIDVPAKGFRWKKDATLEIKGVKGTIYFCSNERPRPRLVLVVQEFTADTEGKKRAILAAHWNTLVETLKKDGFKDLKGTKPSVKAPIPDKTMYGVTGKDKDGKPVAIAAMTFFGKYTYGLQVRGDSEEEAVNLFKVADTLKEQRK
jgi:hypothetical protein